MKTIADAVDQENRPVRVVQFGEGVFLRAFVDYMLDVAREEGVFDGSVTVVKPTGRGTLERFERQNNLYTVLLRGRQNGETVEQSRIVRVIDRSVNCYADPGALKELAELETLQFVVSNTTEAGIALRGDECLSDAPADSFPGKVTQLLYYRYLRFGGDRSRALTFLPVELIENNGAALRACICELAEKWGLEPGFFDWLNACRFCNTLVDRIVTGYPADEAPALWERLGYRDELLDVGEPFGLWVIETCDPDALRAELPLDRAGLPVVFTDCLKPYRERKVRVLNGAHTASVLAAYLAGEDIVRDMMKRPLTRAFVDRAVYDELVPTVPLPREEVRAFADAVAERFENPFIDHSLLAISLNSVSKWKTRVLPSVRDILRETGKLPACLTFSFAALMAFYAPVAREDGALICRRGDETYTVRDSLPILDFFWEHRDRIFDAETARELLTRADFWGEDLSRLDGLTDRIAYCLRLIDEKGIEEAVRTVTEE